MDGFRVVQCIDSRTVMFDCDLPLHRPAKLPGLMTELSNRDVGIEQHLAFNTRSKAPSTSLIRLLSHLTIAHHGGCRGKGSPGEDCGRKEACSST